MLYSMPIVRRVPQSAWLLPSLHTSLVSDVSMPNKTNVPTSDMVSACKVYIDPSLTQDLS